MKNDFAEEYEALPLRYAYEFLIQNGLGKEADDIRQSKESYHSYTSTLRRGKIVTLLEKHNLLDDFIERYWASGKTDQGKRKMRRYKRIYSSFLVEQGVDEEAEEERIEETSFALEEHLRDYLSNNLAAIETELELYKDVNGVEGIEYPIDDSNRRIDILALGKDGVPVVIELKVSRGYEKVIGQCLYYRNRVKQLCDSRRVRIVIIARDITAQLKAATEDIPDVELYEYKLSVHLKRIK